MLYAAWPNTSMSKSMSSLFVSQRGLLLSVCAQMGCMLTCARARGPVLFFSPPEAPLRFAPPSAWRLLSSDPVWRWRGWSGAPASRGIHWVTAQAAGHEADVHPARSTPTEAPTHGAQTKRHTATYADPLHPLFLSPPRMHEEMGETGERRGRHWFLLYRFRKPVFLEKSDAELLIPSFNFDAFLLAEN